jgi:hypothetical protein
LAGSSKHHTAWAEDGQVAKFRNVDTYVEARKLN